MNDALIGYSGFVGSTLLRQRPFNACYRSTDIADINGRHLDLVVCAGAPGHKWLANREPEADRARIDNLIGHLSTITCDQFVLISTVDVFSNPVNVDEDSTVDETGLHAYGLHRRYLEKFVAVRFPSHLIVRLPGLVGPGLRKNVIFDFLNGKSLASIDCRARFQFYPTLCLWDDLHKAMEAGIRLLHLTAEPVRVAEVAEQAFGFSFTQQLAATPARYDLQSRHADLFGKSGRYQYDRLESLQAIQAYAQSEPKTAEFGAA